MNDQTIRKKILITVMTYPHPSRGYQELVCTAGITEDKEWIRLYPIDYRYRPRNQQFRKYQWIEVDLYPYGASSDHRKESRKPVLETIKVLGEPLSTRNSWRERREIIDQMPLHTVNQLKSLNETENVSLGITKPTEILDLKIEPAEPDWKPEWQTLFNQLRLFGPQQKPLRKIPYKFSYEFQCEDSDKPHHAMIEDWELGVLWLRETERLADEWKAALSVREKYLHELCHPTRDTRFFMGTVFPYNSWVVVGVFWPPKPSAISKTQYVQDTLL